MHATKQILKSNKRPINKNKMILTAFLLYWREQTSLQTKLIFIVQVNFYPPIIIHHHLTVGLAVIRYDWRWMVWAANHYITISRTNHRSGFIIQKFGLWNGYGKICLHFQHVGGWRLQGQFKKVFCHLSYTY